MLKTTVTVPADSMSGAGGDLRVAVPGRNRPRHLRVRQTASSAALSAAAAADEMSVDLPPGLRRRLRRAVRASRRAWTQQDVNLHSWAVPAGAAGNLTLSPATPTVTAGAPTTITANWSGLTAGPVYLGILQFGQGSNLTERHLS